eukprot:gene1775-1805_t
MEWAMFATGTCAIPAASHLAPIRTRRRWLVAAAIFALGLAPIGAQADETGVPAAFSVAGTASLLSQYRFRGLSRSDNQPAVQADLSVTHVAGAYAGVTLTSESPGPAVDMGAGEIDIYAGYSHALGPGGIMLDLGLRGYVHPGRAGGDVAEIYGSLDRQIGPIDLRAGLAYAPPQAHLGHKARGGARDNTYVFAETRADVPGTPLHLHAHGGCTAGGLDYTRSYCDYRAGLGATHKALGIDVSLVGTTLSQADALARPQGPVPDLAQTWRVARSAVVLGFSLQF